MRINSYPVSSQLGAAIPEYIVLCATLLLLTTYSLVGLGNTSTDSMRQVAFVLAGEGEFGVGQVAGSGNGGGSATTGGPDASTTCDPTMGTCEVPSTGVPLD